MVRTVEFSEIIWHRTGVKLPDSDKRYSTRQIQLVQAESTDEDGVRLYEMYVGRARDLVCLLRVQDSDVDSLRLFQNLLFKSRL